MNFIAKIFIRDGKIRICDLPDNNQDAKRLANLSVEL